MKIISSDMVDQKFSELRDIVQKEKILPSDGKFVIVSTPQFSSVAMHLNDVPSDIEGVANLVSRSTLAFESTLRGEPFPRKIKEPYVKRIDEILSELFYSVYDGSDEKICLYTNLQGNNSLVSSLSKSEIEKWHQYLLKDNRLELSPKDPSTFHYTARRLCVMLTKTLLERPKLDAPYR